MSKFQVGGYVQATTNSFRKILAEVNGVYFLSEFWNKNNALEEYEGLQDRQRSSQWLTLDEMNAYYTPCTASEAGFPEEKWRPMEGGIYFYTGVSGAIGETVFYKTDAGDIFRLKSGNYYRTREDAQKALDEIMKREV